MEANKDVIIALAADRATCAAAPGQVTRLLLSLGDEVRAMQSNWSSSIRHALESGNADIIADHLEMLSEDPRAAQEVNFQFLAEQRGELKAELERLRLVDVVEAMEAADAAGTAHGLRLAARDLSVHPQEVLARLRHDARLRGRFIEVGGSRTTAYAAQVSRQCNWFTQTSSFHLAIPRRPPST